LAAQEDRKQGRRMPKGRHDIKFLMYFDWVKYATQVKRYFEAFGQENVHIILSMSFSKTHLKFIAKCLSF
ncbi:MAG: hypothetical protein AAFP10_08655, partial [Pseudomonadota bacterium]